MIIRNARLSDCPAILPLWERLMGHHRAGADELETIDGASGLWLSWLRKSIRSRNSLVLVAEEDGVLIGYALSFIKANVKVYRIRRLGYISDLFVDEGHRGRGIGTQFDKRISEWFGSKKVRHSTLMVHASNQDAHAIYRDWGYKDFKIEMWKSI